MSMVRPPGRGADTLVDVITRAWLRDPDPAIDPVWFAAVTARRHRPPADDGAVGRDMLARLEQRYGADPPLGRPADSISAPLWVWCRERLMRRADSEYSAHLARAFRFLSDLFDRIAVAEPGVAGLLVAQLEMVAAHNLFLLSHAAVRYRGPLLLGRVGDRPAALEVVRGMTQVVAHIVTCRAITGVDEWRVRIPCDPAAVRVGGEVGVSLPDAVLRVTDRTLRHVEAVARALRLDRPGRLDRAEVLFPGWLRRVQPTPAHLMDRWARGAAPLRPLLPDAGQAKQALAELERRGRELSGRTIPGLEEWAAELAGEGWPDPTRTPGSPNDARNGPLPDGLHPPNLFAHTGRSAAVEGSAYGLLRRMLEVVGRPRAASGVGEASILRDVYDNGPEGLKSHVHRANKALRAVGYPHRLTRREVRGEGVFICWEDTGGSGSA